MIVCAAPTGRRVTLRTMPLDMRFKDDGEDVEFGGVVPGQGREEKEEAGKALTEL